MEECPPLLCVLQVSAAELESAMLFLREQLSTEELQLLLAQVRRPARTAGD